MGRKVWSVVIMGLFLLFVGCGSESSQKPHPLPSASRATHTPEKNGSVSSSANATKAPAAPAKSANASASSPQPLPASLPADTLSTPDTPQGERFLLEDLDHRKSSMTFEGSNVRFEKIRQRIVVLSVLSDRCSPCRGMMPYLSMLQKKYAKELFVLGVLVRSDLSDEGLRNFMRHYESNFYLSRHPDGERLGRALASRLKLGENYPLPLTVIYKDGKYVMHIEGAVPYEMLSHLVEGLISPH